MLDDKNQKESAKMNSKLIVAIIGPDGSGKSTQATLLVERLNEKGYPAVYVRPIYLFYNIIASICNTNFVQISPRRNCTENKEKNKNNILSKMEKVLLKIFGYPYALGTYAYMKFILANNKIIVCDRFFYQFLYDIYENWSKFFIKFLPKPDVAFFLEGDIDLLYLRMTSHFDTNVSREYYENVNSLYKEIAQTYGFNEINCKLSRENINDIIFTACIKEMEGIFS